MHSLHNYARMWQSHLGASCRLVNCRVYQSMEEMVEGWRNCWRPEGTWSEDGEMCGRWATQEGF